MNKEQLLQELSAKINSGEISRNEVANTLNISGSFSGGLLEEKHTTVFSVTKMLYVLGAAIVVIGIVIFVSQIWEDIGSFGRVAVTLGLGGIFAFIGSVLLKQKPEDNIGSVFHCMGGVLIPGGAFVLLSELHIDLSSMWSVAITFGVIFAFYLLLNIAQKSPVLTFFTIVNGTAFVYLLVEAIVSDEFEFDFYGNKFEFDFYYNLYAYLTMVVGVIYILLAQGFRNSWNSKLSGILNLFGITMFLGAAFSQVFDSTSWQLFYFILVLGGVFLSVYMRSRSILIMSTLFLVAHVSYITSEYFADSLGWPISLVVLGLIFIGLGYVSIAINKRYIK